MDARLYTVAIAAFVLVIVVILIYLSWYHWIWDQVRKSRCYRLQTLYASGGGEFEVTATDSTKAPGDGDMYKITYDAPAKTTTVECSCRPGSVVNTFDDIPYFDMRTGKSLKAKTTCTCAASLDQTSVYYAGAPGLLRYMYSNGTDKTFFTADPLYLNMLTPQERQRALANKSSKST